MPRVDWGFDMLRYNRVEGLSSALEITNDFSSAYSATLRPRFGVADRIPNGELTINRTNGVGTTSLTGYRRLAVANDWGHPLDFGSGLSAILFGRDEGFYYRATGAELTGDHLLGTSWEWRDLSRAAERRRDAHQSVARQARRLDCFTRCGTSACRAFGNVCRRDSSHRSVSTRRPFACSPTFGSRVRPATAT